MNSLLGAGQRCGRRAAFGLLVAVAAAGCGASGPQPVPVPMAGAAVGAAVGGTDHALGQRGETDEGMVASAHPLASDAGLDMLRRGGNAVDAAVAAAFAIGVVEPMMSGIGGSGSMLIWDEDSERAEHLDFYGSAPLGLDPPNADVRGDPARLVAVPGAVRGLLDAHDRFGRLSRQDVLAPAIGLASDGFPVSPLLARTIADDSAKLTRPGRAQELFWPEMRPLAAGERLVQPELAATLRRIAERGAEGFHEGVVAEEIVAVLRDGDNPITLDDLAGYEPTWRRPVCGMYRGHVVLSSPPPQGGIQVVETLNLLDRTRLLEQGWPTASGEAFHTLASALRTGMADRQAFLGDPDSSAVPAAGLTAPGYADARTLPSGVPERIERGDPWSFDAAPVAGACAAFEPAGAATGGRSVGRGSTAAYLPELHQNDEDGMQGGETTHLSVVDREGSAVSLTVTQGAYFGSGMWAAGTFLNNAMAIFSSDLEGPNALRPGARPTSTTTPTILLQDDDVRMVVGSPGGGRIPPAVVQAIVYAVEYGLDPLEALRMPRMQPQFSTSRIELEQGYSGAVLGEAHATGYSVTVHPPLSLYFGGVHMIQRRGDRWVGAADPRRDGQVRGH